MSKRWKVSNTSVYDARYHIIFCPKYRRKVLVDEIEDRFRELLHQKAEELGVEIESLEVMPDHADMFVKADPTFAPHHLVQQFKGLTSRRLRQEFPSLKSRLPSLWTRSYYLESIGHISENTIQQYIADQKNN